MAPEVARLGHVALETPDLEDSLSFFRDTVGLEEVDRVAGTVYLRGIDESGTNDGNSLDVDDHMLSLVYVAKLHSMQ